MNKKKLGVIGFGTAVGVFGGMFGLGGGVIMIPVLLYVFKKDIHAAAATSLAVIGPMAVSGTIGNIFSGTIVWPAFVLLSAGSIAGAYSGAHMSKTVPRDVLRKMLGVFVLLIALSMIFVPSRAQAVSGFSGSISLLAGLVMFFSGLAVGVFSGLFGLGGGVIMNPLMLFGFGFTAHQTVATSLAVIVPTSLSGTIKQFRQGNIDLKLAGLLAAGACAGSFAGANLKDHINNNYLKVLLGIAVSLIALTMLLKRSKHE